MGSPQETHPNSHDTDVRLRRIVGNIRADHLPRPPCEQQPSGSAARRVRDDDVAGGEGRDGRRQDDRVVLHGRHRAARTAERERRPHARMARATVKEIALRLGNAIAMPVLVHAEQRERNAFRERSDLRLRFSAWSSSAWRKRPSRPASRTSSSCRITAAERRLRRSRQEARRQIRVAGIHVYFCDEVYAKSAGRLRQVARGERLSRQLTRRYSRYVGDALPRWGFVDAHRAHSNGGWRHGGARRDCDPNAPRVNNGISGDARRSTPELGKRAYDQKVDYAVRQIRGFLGMK